jgi:hypothetical protein
MAQDGKSWLSPVSSNPLARVILYYALAGTAAFFLWRVFPAAFAFVAAANPGNTGTISARDVSGSLTGNAPAGAIFEPGLAVTAALSMITAGALALPVAWVYTLTRQSKGYQQSVVQTLIMLPIVVAGVVVLVKNSVALAFSLAGIVAAVRFRTALDDSKDAVYVFLVTALGLAAGVQLTVAVVLSLIFNTTMLLLWYTDFGHSPAPLEGTRAERRLDRALAIANRTGMFVAKLDEEIMKSMSPEQLDALAERAWRRKKKLSGKKAKDDTGEHEQRVPTEERRVGARRNEDQRPEFPFLLRVLTMDPDSVRAAMAPVFEQHLARWRFGGVVHEVDGTHFVEYGVEFKNGDGPESFLESVRSAATPHVMGTELR